MANKKRYFGLNLLVLIIFFIGFINAAILFQDDFDDYTGKPTNHGWNEAGKDVNVVSGVGVGGSNAVRISYNSDSGTGRTAPYTLRKTVSQTQPDELYIQFDFRTDLNHNSDLGGSKFVKIVGGGYIANSGSTASSTTFGFDYSSNTVSRVSYGGDARKGDTQTILKLNGDCAAWVVGQCHDVDFVKVSSPLDFRDGKWHNVVLHMKYNTVTNGVNNRDGEYDIWMDGVLRFSARKVINIHPENPHYWEQVFFGDYTNSLPSSTVNFYYDNIIIADSPINSTTSPSPSPVICTTDETISCSTGLKGICSTGTKTCSNNAWGSCSQTKQATTEICGNNLDDDCDGVIDNGCSTTETPSTTGKILYQNCAPGGSCTGAGSNKGWIRTVETNGCYSGQCLKLVGIANTNTAALAAGIYGAGSTSIATHSIKGKKEITVQYRVKFNKNAGSISGGNLKSFIPYLGNVRWGTVILPHPSGGFYISRVIGTFTTAPWFSPVTTKTNKDYAVVNPDGTYYSWNGHTLGKFNNVEEPGTEWKKITVYFKLPTTDSSNDGIVKVWYEDELMLDFKDSSVKNIGETDTFTSITFYSSSEAKEPFEHWMDDMIIYEGYVPPTESSTPVPTPSPEQPVVCTTGQNRSCSTGLNGICSTGAQTCSNNVWSSCTQTTLSTTEICGNNLDDDCDGTIDENCNIDNVVTVDSIYNGYSIDKIDDGIIDKTASYSQGSFATKDTNTPHWIEFNLQNETKINKLTIHWAYNGQQNSFMSSQEVQIQNWNGNSFATIATITNIDSVENSTISFDAITTKKFRLYQPENKGYINYSTVLWVTEIDYEFEATNNQIHKADTNKNSIIEFAEVVSFLSKWQKSESTFDELIEVIKLWRK